MTQESTRSDEHQPRDAADFAQDAATLYVAGVPAGVLNLNMDGRREMSPPLVDCDRKPFAFA